MILNTQQAEAVEMARWLARNSGDVAVGVVAGPAGTGKSSLLKEVCQELGDVVLIAPTNRAAQRASKLSNVAATTIHGWLYSPREEEGGRISFVKRGLDKIRVPASNVIIVDEASMVGPDVWGDIWTAAQDTRCSILLVGDAFQLPPVVTSGDEFSVFDSEFEKRVLELGHKFSRVNLTEVFRQARESAVLRACTELRSYPDDWRNAAQVMSNLPSRDNPDKSGYGFPHPDNIPARLLGMIESQMDHCCIAYTNDKRRQINRDVRALRGWSDEDDPQPGEPLLVRRNSKGAGVSNGETIVFTGFLARDMIGLPPNYRFLRVNGVECLTSMDGIVSGVSPKPSELRGLPVPYVDCQYGYAATAHHSQGGQWDTALVVYEQVLMKVYAKAEMRIRWIYTGFSRAKKNLLIGGLR